MKTEPYANLRNEDLILRDYLAADRTILANERTFLAYIRTALTFGISAAALIKFFDSPAAEILGWMLVPLAIGTVGVGTQRFLHTKQRINKIISRAEGTSHK